MFKLRSSAAPGQAHSQTTLAEIASSWKEKLAQPEQAPQPQGFSAPCAPDPEDNRHEAKMRQVHLECLGRLWAAIRAGTLADRATSDELLALMATCPDGTLPRPATETMRKRLEALASTGFLTPGEDGLFDRASVASALPRINAPDDAAIHAWLAAAVGKVQRAPSSVEREAIAKRRAIKGAVATLEQGGIGWPDIHVSTLAHWLVETVPELAGADQGSIKRVYLRREGLAPASCSTGRCSVEIERLERRTLDTTYRQGCAAQFAGQTVAVPIPLRAAG